MIFYKVTDTHYGNRGEVVQIKKALYYLGDPNYFSQLPCPAEFSAKDLPRVRN